MKVVVSRCYGGFGLSLKAQKEYCKLIGRDVFFYKQTKYGYKDSQNEYIKLDENIDDAYSVYSIFVDLGDKTEKLPNENENWFIDRDIDRTDTNLVLVVESLGEKANTRYSDLEIVEIPDGIEYVIEEYDGVETIAEKHRKW